jgi:predicted small secreted protein
LLTACEIIERAGRDIGTAGDAIAQASREVQAGN